ncbi:hypothetical protein PVK06_007523 [Gossypium arboreum]|uniref:SWIM-type domain-containing protein n=1 Tax=Gossypium arboreum TaxID=29729 RepID=A0ABR0QHJ5_GOSAR|nr:hypothetical protein PVK06_007523 [Gossypium arboreum]
MASYPVDLPKKVCNCGRFQALRFPCAYVIVTCAYVQIVYTLYINDVYKLEHMANVWRPEFPLVLDESMWSPMSSALFKLAPNMNLSHVPRGRPTSIWIGTNMVVWERDKQ